MAQWGRVLVMQTNGPDFKSPTLPEKSVSSRSCNLRPEKKMEIGGHLWLALPV